MPTPNRPRRGRSAFDRFAEQVSSVVSEAPFFTGAVILVVLWMPTIALFSSVDTWQLVINTATSVLAFLLIALLQNSERRTDQATNQKLDILAAGLADLLEVQEGGDREAMADRVRQLRAAIRIEEKI